MDLIVSKTSDIYFNFVSICNKSKSSLIVKFTKKYSGFLTPLFARFKSVSHFWMIAVLNLPIRTI